MLFFQQYKIQDNVLTVQNDESYNMQKQFYTQQFDPSEKKIFLFDSSHIYGLNPKYIDKIISNNNYQNYHVYNLGLGSDTPTNRLKTIEMAISAKPEIVVYGIAPRDFQNPATENNPSLNTPTKLLPSPKQFVDDFFNIIENSPEYNLNFLKNPQLTTLQSINRILPNSNEIHLFSPYPDTPFLRIEKENTIIHDNYELEKFQSYTAPFTEINEPEKNTELKALKDIINKLQENHIKVIIFTTPQHKFYLESLPNSYKESFNSILKNLSSTEHLQIYSLQYKYKDLKIWNDITHVAANENSTIFSQDIAKIILNETRP